MLKGSELMRDLPLWPETIESLEKITKTGKLVFYTSRGNPYIQTFLKTDGYGNGKYTTLNSITPKFSRLIKKSGLDVPKGTGFYTLRRTAATIAARSGDPFAVQRLLAMRIYKWQQGMCRMFQNKRTELLKRAGCMFVRLVSSTTKNLCGEVLKK